MQNSHEQCNKGTNHGLRVQELVLVSENGPTVAMHSNMEKFHTRNVEHKLMT